MGIVEFRTPPKVGIVPIKYLLVIYHLFKRNIAMRLHRRMLSKGILFLGLLLGSTISTIALSPVEQVSVLAEQGNAKAQTALAMLAVLSNIVAINIEITVRGFIVDTTDNFGIVNSHRQ